MDILIQFYKFLNKKCQRQAKTCWIVYNLLVCKCKPKKERERENAQETVFLKISYFPSQFKTFVILTVFVVLAAHRKTGYSTKTMILKPFCSSRSWLNIVTQSLWNLHLVLPFINSARFCSPNVNLCKFST